MNRKVFAIAAVLVGLSLTAVAVSDETAPDSSALAGAPTRAEHVASARQLGDEPLGAGSLGDGGLEQVATFTFPAAITDGPGFVAIPGSGLVALVTQDNVLIVYDARDGSIVHDEVVGGYNVFPGSVEIVDEPDFARLVVGHQHRLVMTQIYDLSIPEQPVVAAVADTCSKNIVALRGTRSALAFGRGCAQIFSLETGETQGTLDGYESIVSPRSFVDSSGSLLVFLTETGFREWSVITLDVTDPDHPRELDRQIVVSDGRSTYSLLADRQRRAMVAWLFGEILVLDGSGAPRSSVPFSANRWQLELVETEDEVVLAVAYPGGIDLWDITDPTAPQLRAVLDEDPYFKDSSRTYMSPVRALSDRPWLAVAVPDAHQLVMVDVRDGTVASRLQLPNAARPVGLAIDEHPVDGPLVTTLAKRRAGGLIFEPGGDAVLESASFADPSQPVHLAGYREVTPREIDGLRAFGGRYIATLDRENNAINVVDIVSRAVVAGNGLVGTAAGESGDGFEGNVDALAARGSTVAMSGRFSLQVFRFDGTALLPLARLDWPSNDSGQVTDVEILRDGTVAFLRGALRPKQVLEVWHPDGRRGRLDIEATFGSAGVGAIELHPTEDLLLLSSGTDAYAADNVMLVDVADPAAPTLRWRSADRFSFVNFSPEGETVVAAQISRAWYISPTLLDLNSGEPLTEPGEGAPIFFHWGGGTTFGSGDNARVSYWHWTFFAWASVIFDISGDRPVIAGHSNEYFIAGPHLPRAGGDAYYDFVAGGVLLGSGSGAYSVYGIGLWSLPEELVPGYLVVRLGRPKDRQLALLRDTAITPPRIPRQP